MAIFPDPDAVTAEWWRGQIKKLAPKTLQARRSILFQALNYLGRENQIEELRKVKLPKVPDSVTVEDLYTKEQLNTIFQHCQHPRDRAMLQVLYEGALRAGELLSMDFNNIQFEEDGTANIIVKGKTGTRSVPIFASVPALKEWLNHHPKGDGAVWTTVIGDFSQLTWSGLYQTVSAVLNRAQIKSKRKLIHMFRHTRITELVKLGIRGQTLHKLVGWTKKSNMEAVYVHLSTADVVNEVRTKVFGLEEDKDRYEPIIKPIKCPRCESVNEPQARFCKNCNMPIASDAVVRAIDTQKQTEERFQYLENTIAQLGRMVNAYSSAIADALKEGKTSIDVIKISERLATNFIDETEHDH